jgi:hypothetical protein
MKTKIPARPTRAPLLEGNPLAPLFPIYEAARIAAQQTSQAKAEKDWIRNKQSKIGSASQKDLSTSMLSGSGNSVLI